MATAKLKNAPGYRWWVLIMNCIAYGSFFMTIQTTNAFGNAISAQWGLNATKLSLLYTGIMITFAFTAGLGGKIDCLYNNAGILGDRLGILEFDPEGFKEAYNVNVFGTMYMIQLVARTMVERKIEGVIINTSSLNGETITWDPVGYITSKWAIQGITRTCAFQLADYKIRVNAVAPGATITPMAHASWEDPDVYKVVASMHLRNMWIKPEQVADAAYFLASDASYAINGQILHVDDGYCVGKSADFTSIGAQH